MRRVRSSAEKVAAGQPTDVYGAVNSDNVPNKCLDAARVAFVCIYDKHEPKTYAFIYERHICEAKEHVCGKIKHACVIFMYKLGASAKFVKSPEEIGLNLGHSRLHTHKHTRYKFRLDAWPPDSASIDL